MAWFGRCPYWFARSWTTKCLAPLGVALSSSHLHFMKLRFVLLAALAGCPALLGAELRLGIIGCDTSHVTAFTETLNNPKAKEHIPGGKVVAAYKGGSPDIPASASRVEGYTKTLQEK